MAEEVIIVDEQDRVIESDTRRTKKQTHLWSEIEGGLLHRAFSVFLFDESGSLLVQRRSSYKITFPLMWANTCCSHPLFGTAEMRGVEGAIAAARRKLGQELGIDSSELPASCFQFMTRVHYIASQKGGVWGEHEMDYVLICRPPGKVTLAVNENEVSEVAWIPQADLKTWIADRDAKGEELSQWFRLISSSLLPQWWSALIADRGDGGNRLAGLVEEGAIYRSRSPADTALVREPRLA